MVGLNTSTVKANTNYIEDGYETEHRFDTFQTSNIDEEVLKISNQVMWAWCISSTSIYHKHCKYFATKQYYACKHEVSPGPSTSDGARSTFDWKKL